MAGDWIPMRLDLAEDPAVIGIAAATGLDELAVVGRLHKLWAWANQQTADGNAHGVTDSWVDRYACAAGFACAMIAHGWLMVTKHGLVFPEFERWNSQGAKRRILATRRVQRCRNASRNAPSVNKTLTREEKRREENTKNPPTPLQGDAQDNAQPDARPSRKAKRDAEHPRFGEFWKAYPRKVDRCRAAAAFAKVDPDEPTVARMLASLGAWSASWDWRKDDGRFIPHPTTWINGRRWEDEPPRSAEPPAQPRRGFETETERRLREAQMILGDDTEDHPT